MNGWIGPGLDGPDISNALLLDEPDRPPVVLDPRQEAIAAGPYLGDPYPRYGEGLAFPRLNRRRVAMMRLDPAVEGSFMTVKAAALAGGFKFLPCWRPGEDEEDVAHDFAAECRRTTRALELTDAPLEVIGWELCDALADGHILAELLMDDVVDGPDAGKLSLVGIRPKSPGSYQFGVDRAWNLKSIYALDLAGEWRHFDTDHFLVLTHDRRKGDPRGRSAFGPAWHPWDMKVHLWPDCFKGWKQFGTPLLAGICAPNAQPVPQKDNSGKVIPGKPPLSPQQAIAASLLAVINNQKVAGLPHGAEVRVIESSKDGTVVAKAIELLDLQIIRAILLAPRATTEARFGSRADSQSGQDVVATYVRYLRGWLCGAIRKAFYRQLAANHGPALALRRTPLVTLGEVDMHTFSAIASAVGVLYQAGYFTEPQLHAIDVMLDLPERGRGEARVGPAVDASAQLQAADANLQAAESKSTTPVATTGAPA